MFPRVHFLACDLARSTCTVLNNVVSIYVSPMFVSRYVSIAQELPLWSESNRGTVGVSTFAAIGRGLYCRFI